MGEADGLEGAVFAFAGIGGGEGCLVGLEEGAGLLDGGFGLLAEGGGEGNGDAAAGAVVEDFAVGDGGVEHFFEAEGLGAELDLVVVPLSFLAVFVFDGDGLVGVGGVFDEVGDAGNF